MAYLTQYSSSVPVIKFNIDQPVMTIGQNFDMDISVAEDGIAESHATVEAIKEAQSYRFIIKSNADETLLELNGAAVSHAELKDRDWIVIGGVEFQFTDDGVNEIKEMTKPVATAPTLAVVEPIEKKNVEAELTIPNEAKPMSTKEYVAKSRYSRRRLAF
ncbi:MAG: hypothetical protein KAT06_11740 [Gammaproteobacteria bacterium]|nr:hypothetical protein [Gammaproteobacteria bacterium]